MKTDLVIWADWYQKIRTFFLQKAVLEVHTPLLLDYPVSDPYIDTIKTKLNTATSTPKTQYLHTSPELAMKVLLAQGSGDIYQICPTFRDNEWGRYNFNEFTLLEWYRLGFSSEQLITEVLNLLGLFMPKYQVLQLSYQQAFTQFAGVDILNQDLSGLKKLARQHDLNDDFSHLEDGQVLLFVHLIEPQLKPYAVSIIKDYPQAQAGLAQINGQTAKRFEVYIKGVEIANGYEELQAAKDYRHCFNEARQKRTQLGKKLVAIDEVFLHNIKDGLPACTGVALGLSRLFALLYPQK